MKPIKEQVTKEKFQEYLEEYRVIRVIPLVDEDPIFALMLTNPRIIGTLGQPKEILIHKGYFILPGGVKRGTGGSKTISQVATTAVNYPTKFKKSHPAKEFLIVDVWDKEITLESPVYVTPIRQLFKTCGLKKELRGVYKKPSEWMKKRRDFVIEKYEESKRIEKYRALPMLILIRRIYHSWASKVDEYYGIIDEYGIDKPGDEKRQREADQHYFSEETIRKDINSYQQRNKK